MLVRGDQWPLFLYADLAYDPQDPWNGLLRSELLVAVRYPHISHFFTDTRRRDSNMYSLRRALLTTTNRRQQGRVMPAFMV